MVKAGGDTMRHKYTPHTCRHTFATLLKNVQASDKDKLALIGHTSDEMLRYYQDVNLADLEKITNML
jgi:integrase